ncbi:MAG: endo-1,4-beta-xylanase [Prevotella sp.]|nr:endo-1,4-beta-xylanase [Prevotella sp.]
MRRTIKISVLLLAVLLPAISFAQISSNPNKFLGNITTRGSVDAGGGVPNFYTLWNQITCENESKWSSVEGTRGSFNWNGAENAFTYAKNHNFTHKFHALVWGAQYPGWLPDLSPKERFAAITNWFDHAKAKFNTLPMIDVVNEAVGNHQDGNPMIKESLGGGGKTGYDWLIKAFDMAYQRWPDAILIYNDYNSIRWDVNNYITLVRTLRDAGAPIDAYGNQSHELSDISLSELQSVLAQQQSALQMPMFVTELDIDIANDEQQKSQYQKVLPVMWEAPYCAGVTLWGYIHGSTWVGNSGLYKNGVERPAMTWIKEYMQTDAAKNAVGPLPGAKKEASVYIRPAALKVVRGDVLPIKVHARLATKTIQKVELYVEDQLVQTMTEAPYVVEYNVPSSISSGWKTTKAVVTATDGTTYERYGRFSVVSGSTKRAPYNESVPELPGTINADEYDKGVSGITYSNATRNTSTITKDGQWMDYTVDVTEDGIYTFDATVAAANSNGRFHIAEYGLDSLSYLTEFVEVPNTGGSSVWKTMRGKVVTELKAGRHVFTLLVEKGGFYIKDITFNRYEAGDGSCLVKAFTEEYGIGDHITISAKASSKTSTVSEVRFYADNLLIGTDTESPYECVFVPKEKGTYAITAVAVDAEGREKTSNPRQLKVTSDTPTDIRTVVSDDETDTPTYNIMGVPVDDSYRGIVIKNGKKYIKK